MAAPITPNPGGTIHPDQVIGRDELVARYWDTLSNRSLVLLAPRRLGKTSVCRLMEKYPSVGFVAHYRDLEGRASSPLDLVQALFEDTERYMSRAKRTAQRARKLLAAFGDSVETTWAKLKLDPPDWRPLLEATLTDLNEWAEQNNVHVVLFWDEFTLFLNDLIDTGPESAREAMTLLDRLRAARAVFPRIRMVYTGSIGLEEVLRVLRRQGYANDPTNDMAKEILPLLEPQAAAGLAEQLLASFEKDGAKVQDIAAHIADICEGHPFLIQHVANRLRRASALPADPDAAKNAAQAALSTLLDDTSDPLELSHYVERLEKYFNEQDRLLAIEVLDALALAEEPVALEDLRGATGSPSRDALLGVLQVLRRDLYLERQEGRWSFRLEFLRRYWKLERGL